MRMRPAAAVQRPPIMSDEQLRAKIRAAIALADRTLLEIRGEYVVLDNIEQYIHQLRTGE